MDVQQMKQCTESFHYYNGWPLYPAQCQCQRDRMKVRLKDCGIFFALQFISYFNITVDMRAVNHDQYAVAAITNIAAPLIAWIMVERVSTAKDRWGMVAVALGGVTSTLVGMWLTRWW